MEENYILVTMTISFFPFFTVGFKKSSYVNFGELPFTVVHGVCIRHFFTNQYKLITYLSSMKVIASLHYRWKALA